jgi:hypothetical protein
MEEEKVHFLLAKWEKEQLEIASQVKLPKDDESFWKDCPGSDEFSYFSYHCYSSDDTQNNKNHDQHNHHHNNHHNNKNNSNMISINPTTINSTTTSISAVGGAGSGANTTTNTIRKDMNNRTYCCHDNKNNNKLIGGVDVSFGHVNRDNAVAVYVITRNLEVIYRDSLVFTVTQPYISSFLGE